MTYRTFGQLKRSLNIQTGADGAPVIFRLAGRPGAEIDFTTLTFHYNPDGTTSEVILDFGPLFVPPTEEELRG